MFFLKFSPKYFCFSKKQPTFVVFLNFMIMNLQKEFGVLTLDGIRIGSYAGFYSVKDLTDILSRKTGRTIYVHSLYRTPQFRRIVKLMLGIELDDSCKPISVLKDSGLYIRHFNNIYCDIKIFVIIYALSCDEAMVDCLHKSFGI